MTSGVTAIAAWVDSFRPRESRLRGRLRSRSRARKAAFEALEGRITPATFLVVNPLDGPGDGPSGSLRNAISRADQSGDASDTIVITSKVRGTIALNSGQLTIDSNLSLVNRSGGPIEIRQNTPDQRVFDVASGSAATRVSIAGAPGRGAITIDRGAPSTGNGGGILVENPANILTLTNVNLVGNTAGLATSSNAAQNGGGVDSSGEVVLVRSTIGTQSSPNQTSGSGGGVWAGAGLSMTASSVNGNEAGTDGGGVYVNGGDATIAARSSVSANSATLGTDGGVYVADGDTTVSRSRVDDNVALDSGGIDEVKGNVRVVLGSEVNRNSSTAPLDVSAGDFGGGGIVEGVGNVLISRSQVNGNHSVGMYSSGIVVSLGGVTVTARSQVDGNSADGPGGGIAANFGGVVTIRGGSQVDGNSGAGNGGGIVNFSGPAGGVRVLGGSEVSHNTLTNDETLGQAIGVFLELIAESVGLDFTTASGGTSPAALSAEITQIEQEVATTVSPDASLNDPPGFLVTGGGIGTLLGGPITIGGGSHVDDNLSGAPVATGNPNSVGIGGGLFSGLGSITLRGGTVSGNTALGSGGGIWNQGSLTVVGGSISGNNAVSSLGGGLYNATGGTASILRGTLRRNLASRGGGVFNSGTLGLVGSLITGNHASSQGGGIAGGGSKTLVRTQVVANTPDNIA